MSIELRTAEPVLIESLRFLRVSDSECQLAGTLSSDAAQQELSRQLDLIHDNLQASSLGGFTVDLQKLEFVNSSAIRLFVNWISRAQSTGYKLTFLMDRSVTWQRLSFSSLRALAPEFVDLVDGSAPRETEARQ